jgi:hypothetical protein
VFVHTKELEKAIFSYGSGITGMLLRFLFNQSPEL